MIKYSILNFFLIFSTLVCEAQIALPAGTNIEMYNSASEGDFYIDNDSNFYIGLSNGGLKIIPKEDSESLPTGTPTIPFENPVIWLSSTSVPVTSSSYETIKSFTLKGDILQDKNAVRITCWRRRQGGNMQINFRYGGQSFFTSGSLGNNSARMEFIIFSNGNANSQRAYMDDANTGGNGQRTGTLSINSAVDQTVEIRARRASGSGTAGFIDFCSSEALIYE
ncbi:MAG: hypothetical protein N4A45_09730 [Flavobacteriales bacterium]|jgi:hypothetical protein|nr:hypothetical protein [Flavobacteriales bacterium]